MTHDEKVAYFIKEMVSRGHKESKVAPPLLKFLWKRGLTVPPFLFAKFFPLLLATGIPFGLIWGVFMWVVVWGPEGKSILLITGATLSAGLFFGVTTAWLVRRSLRKLGLPSWKDYPTPAAGD